MWSFAKQAGTTIYNTVFKRNSVFIGTIFAVGFAFKMCVTLSHPHHSPSVFHVCCGKGIHSGLAMNRENVSC